MLSSRWLLLAAVVGALVVGWLVSMAGLVVPALLVATPLLGFFLVLVFSNPRAGFVAYIVYCFLIMTMVRHIPGIPFGLGMEALLLLTWISAAFHQSGEFSWGRLQNSLCLLALAWFGINVLELLNPAGASPVGWFYEMRGTTLFLLLTAPLTFLVFYRARDLRLFLCLIILFSVLGTLYGIKQDVFGVDFMEQQWLNQGAYTTHIIWGKLRIFSFFSEAAQFGASQAHVGVICLILALGPFVWWKRLLFAAAALLLFYGMLISGTRGAMFVLLAGVFTYLILSKQTKILLLGSVIALGALGVLKYTTIGNGNANIVRLRTSINPQDASFQLRLKNQATLRQYLASRPFGGGVGTIGMWGVKYNNDKFLASIAPDSYYVKVWAEYGIVGFLIWIGMMFYIQGRCCGIVWNTRDARLRQKLLALTAGSVGILVSSYGNEVINQMPSSMIVYISWAFIFLGPDLDTPVAPSAHA
ncbi:O-antigen ligase family protein [Hymenobacter terrenus]|uniref:O-antigen ligase family protein n=1 Tax=Hymenobacter terrenus TaxID=1629124 RepID=UPI0018CC9FB0|nr:O-antigen ligase family protein [Hymenobacter terrenus]